MYHIPRSAFFAKAAVVIALLSNPALVAAATASDVPTLVQRVFEYIPSRVAAVVVGVAYAIIGAILSFHIAKGHDWWGLCLPIGAFLTSAGFFVRVALVSNQNSLGLFAMDQVLIVCTPGAFLAFNYIVYGRLVLYCIGRQHSLIRPEIVARVFVFCDIATFLVQAGGSGMLVAKQGNLAKLGPHIVIAGLALQGISYIGFIVMLAHAHRRIIKENDGVKKEPWWRVVGLLYLSSFFIVIRLVYRMIEFGQGNGGYLVTHEAYFYLLDTVPLFIAIACYAPFWPGNYIDASDHKTPAYDMELGSRADL